MSLGVVVMDADRTHVSRLKSWLQNIRHVRLAHASKAKVALRMLSAWDWNLLVVDPHSADGREVLIQAKRLNPWLAVFVVTGNRSSEFIEQTVQCRIDDLMFKPLARTAFLERAVQLAAEARGRQQREQRRVLAIGAHPDDVELGCAGTLAKHIAEGDVVKILTMSRGAAGGDSRVRMREARRAAKVLGATVEFGNLPDAHISEGFQTIALIERFIRKMQPTHVYTHAPEDTHQDHRAVHAATLVAAREVPNVYCYQAPSSTVDFHPTHFVDINGFVEFKLRAIEAHESQATNNAPFMESFVKGAAYYWGRFAGHGLVEPMRVVRQREGLRAPLGERGALAPSSLSEREVDDHE